ncbi:MAG: hypothetical protein DRO05_07250 [Thermoproteota archaeon]|nr:MAG: hypothetical protein DRO05_07250 [Candidatus Korarchaeota archaeon]
MEYEQVLGYYSRSLVKREISEYCRGRWVALESPAEERRTFFRYAGRKPLKIEEIDDVEAVLRRFRLFKPRTFYATANVYNKLDSKEDLEDPNNIALSTPIWDIDNELERWKQTLEAARLIVDELERGGVVRSVYLKWSGRGCHVHVHEKAFSPELLEKHNPLDLSYSIVEYVLRRVGDRVKEIAKSSKEAERPLAIENEMDLKRVFTVPLSLHRTLNLAAVCFKPDEIDEFSLDWAEPLELRHNEGWREHEVGEADDLAKRALGEIGGYFRARVVGMVRGRVGAPKKEEKRGAGKRVKKLGRFQVMGLLQAARYYVLRGDLKKAKSFGLNRAIFYAWAKRTGGRVGRRAARARAARPLVEAGVKEVRRLEEHVGDEVAYLSEDGFFSIGDQVQRPEDYDRQIAGKIDPVIPYEQAWEAALRYVSKFPREVLLDQRGFFEKVYKPVRDKFLEVIEKEQKQARLDI